VHDAEILEIKEVSAKDDVFITIEWKTNAVWVVSAPSTKQRDLWLVHLVDALKQVKH